jgi:hypothetical protein
MAKVVNIIVTEFVRETPGSWHVQFEGLTKPTYIPKEMRGISFARISECVFECPKWLAEKTAKALGTTLDDITTE